MAQKPKCRDKEMADLLPWYVSKSLSEIEMVRVEQHLSECPSCTEELKSIKWISEGLYAVTGENGSKHINSLLLTIYSESKKELKKEVIQRIENHLSLCQQCSKELEILKNVNQSLETSEVESFYLGITQKIYAFFAKPILKPAYAYILVLALLYPAWLGLFSRNGAQDKIAEPVNIRKLVVLELNDQRAPGEQSNEVILNNPSDLFAFSFVLPILNQEDNVYQTTISNDKNNVVWHDENLKFIDQYGTVIIVCPQKYFSEGKYYLNVNEKQRLNHEVINKYMFIFKVFTKD
jgi:hypothetical protein